MISTRTGNGPVPTPIEHVSASVLASSSTSPRSSAFRLFGSMALHLRGLVRLAQQRRNVAFALCAVSVSGIATAAAALATVQHLHAAGVEPLAPVSKAKAPTLALAPHRTHHFFIGFGDRTLRAFDASPLRKLEVNPLRGIASWYGSVLHGHKTASGEVFDEAEMTACHRTLPFGTLVRVTDTSSQRSVVVRINDRGVLAPDRVIDLSAAAANELGILRSGIAHVRLEVLHKVEPQSPTKPVSE